MREYERRTSVLTFEQAAYWEPRYLVGAVLYAGALGVWCMVTILGTEDTVASCSASRVTIGLHRRRRGAELRPPDDRAVAYSIRLRADCRSHWALRRGPYYIGSALLLVLFSSG